MSNSSATTLALGACLIVLLTTTTVAYCQQQLTPSLAPSSAPQGAILVPSSLSNRATASSSDEVQIKPNQAQEWPMVNVDNQANKSTVDVHVPIFFDMVNQADKDSGKAKLDLSVLQGLVTVNKDKQRDANGQMTGPVKVTVFGIPVYTGKGVSSAVVRARSEQQPEEANSIEARRASLAASTDEVASSLTDKVQRVNDKIIGSLSDIFERFSTALKRQSGAGESEQLKIERDRANPARFQSQTVKLLDGNKEDRRMVLESQISKA